MEEKRSSWEGGKSSLVQDAGTSRERNRQTQAPTGFEGMNYEQERAAYQSASKNKQRSLNNGNGQSAPNA